MSYTTNILSVTNLTIGYQSKKNPVIVAEDINFTAKSGELIGLIGSNGIGKSTLLRTITGMQPKILGNIDINGSSIHQLSPIQLATQISIVTTEAPASKNLTVYELVTLGRHPYTNWIGKLTQQDKHIINNALLATETLPLSAKKCFELSDGQLQRVLIARALAQDTPFIFLDEPTTHLDLYHRAYLLKFLKTISQTNKKSILFSTHEIDLAIEICDKILLMKPNQSIFESPENLIKQKHFSTLFPEKIISFDEESRTFKMNK